LLFVLLRITSMHRRYVTVPITRWNANRDFEQLFNRFFNLGGETPAAFPRFPFANKEQMTLADWVPAVDIQETQEAYVVNAELPDVKKEDVKITVHDGVLSLMGERRIEKEEKGKKYHRIERSYGRFGRTFALPDSIDEQKIQATYRDGVLHLMLPKAPSTKPTTREIKVG
jgi:HSP20 family protein